MRLIVLSTLAAVAGCAETFPMPMTAAELAAHDSGPALVAYLGQADASPAVCDLRAGGPHLPTVDDDARKALVRALGDGTVAPELWRRCVNALARSSPPADAAALVDAVGRGYRTLIRRRDFEKTPALQQRLAVMQRFYIERNNGLDGDAAVDGKLFAELRRALDAHTLGPAATASAEELLATFELEHGAFRGQPVDTATIDGLFTAGDEPTLMRFANRLPEPSLREAARRRVIRLHIAASPFPEVRAAAATVEEAVAHQGVWALSLAEHPPLRGWLDLPKVPMRGVLVRQHVWEQMATLLGYAGDRPGLSVLPELKLTGALLVEAQGISRPVTLCASPRKLDPSPCLDVHDVTLANPMAYLDKGGAFHFVDHVAMRDAVSLAQMGDRFVLPLSVGGTRLLTFDWSLYYERPADVVYGDGAPLHVVVDHRDPGRFVFTIGGAGASRLAVVERGDAAAFHVVSRGADGAPGMPGSDGASGSSGGECSDGSPGGDGGPGGPGGDGGDGGDIIVDVTCAGASCDAATMASVRAMVLSLGGDGGPGGAGGAGGMGGAGGSGRSPTTHTDDNGNTITDDPGCSAGSSGASGSSGSSGVPGSPGRPGHVRFRVF